MTIAAMRKALEKAGVEFTNGKAADEAPSLVTPLTPLGAPPGG